MKQCGKKWIQKKLPKVLSFQQLLHIYSKGTTCVNKYIVPNILGKVLSELRNEGRCYIKYERKQRCFHITSRK